VIDRTALKGRGECGILVRERPTTTPLIGRLAMPSPFPGMDPYLETPALWSDLHARFITYWRDALNDCLPDN
jgi:hypothetical protein